MEVEVSGLLEAVLEEPTKKPTGEIPPHQKKSLVYTFPIEPRKISVNLSGKIPPAIELLFLVALGIFTILFSIFSYIYRRMLPITITLKTDKKASAFKIRDSESITIGGGSDFELDGCHEVIARIQRYKNKFFLLIDREDILANSFDGKKTGKFLLHFGQSLNFNINGTYHTIQFLEGDQEDTFQFEEQANDNIEENDKFVY